MHAANYFDISLYLHLAASGGTHEDHVKVEIGRLLDAALVLSAGRRQPDNHLQQVCKPEQATSARSWILLVCNKDPGSVHLCPGQGGLREKGAKDLILSTATLLRIATMCLR